MLSAIHAMKKIKVIATIGPSSNKKDILNKLKDRGVDFFRINLSHTIEEDIERTIQYLKEFNVPIIIDTEGFQIRSGNTDEVNFKEGENIKLFNKKVSCSSNSLFLNPAEVIANLRIGDLISIGFNEVLLKVFNISALNTEGYIECKVLISGKVGSKKAVHIDSPTFMLPAFSKKDLLALEIAKNHYIKHFTLSFMESGDSVQQFKTLYPDAIVYSKIESKKGLDNFVEIANESEGILIDRGDLSSQVPIEKIPLIQKHIIHKCKEMNKEVFVATDTLADMSFSLKPNRAEVNDIINTILDGATGFALTKELAVGKYPVETVNMMNSLIKQVESLNLDSENLSVQQAIEKSNYINSEHTSSLLISPHGGVLVDRVSKKKYNQSELPKKKIMINEETLMDVEQIAIGTFSPIQGFLVKADFESVVDNMRLSNGVIWTIPIILSIDEQTKNQLDLTEGEDISLVYKEDNETYAILHLEEIYKPNKEQAAEKIYNTLSQEHPGVKKFLEQGDYFLGGKITLLKRRTSQYKLYELTPSQTRKIFAERGWSKVLGFHTRNAIHRSHEFLQLEGLKKGLCDGLFVHPIIGKKKPGDFEANVIISSYEKMIDHFYPNSRVLLCSFATFSRYAGPREAIFTALSRKNFGCTHFVVGRDHTGVKDFYHPQASHKIFDKFSQEELGIIPIRFDKVFYSALEGKYLHEPEHLNHPEDKKMHISGTQAREMLKKGEQPPEWFMRKEISNLIIDKIKSGEKVFVEEATTSQTKTEDKKPFSFNLNNSLINIKQTKILWFTGLSGSGKTTVSDLIVEHLKFVGKSFEVFDGDEVRKRFNTHLGFTPEDIKENNRIILELCKQSFGKVDYILVPIISPFKESRQKARDEFRENFVEVYFDCSYEDCKKRDVKGLYKKAENGEIKDFIGLHVPYEPADNPEIRLKTIAESPFESCKKVLDFIYSKEQ